MAGKINQQLGGGNCEDTKKVTDDDNEEEMSWIGKKLLLYNVTIGLYAMDWWERYLFNSIVLVLLYFIFYGTTRSIWLVFENKWHILTKQLFNFFNTVPQPSQDQQNAAS